MRASVSSSTFFTFFGFLQVSGFGHRVSGFGFQVSGFACWASDDTSVHVWLMVSVSSFQVVQIPSGFCRVLRGLCFGFRVSDFGSRVSGFACRASGGTSVHVWLMVSARRYMLSANAKFFRDSCASGIKNSEPGSRICDIQN